jgi:hypothetical protein
MNAAGCFLPPTHGVCAVMTRIATILQTICLTPNKPVLYSLIIMLFGTGFSVAAETDDSSLFVEAFTAYQKKDYLLTIEKITSIEQLFPDTPLRDVALLLLARSALKSGDNELAATTINRFSSEFPANPLTSTIEEELLSLGIRRQKAELLPPAIPLRSAAQKVRREQLALERSSLDKSTAGHSEQERLAIEKATQDNVRVSINLPLGAQTVAVGQRGRVPFEVFNLGITDEDFLLETIAPPEYETMLEIAGNPEERLPRVPIGTASPLTGSIMFRMPADKIDGHKTTISLRTVSEKYPHIIQTGETHVITAAPLVRVVAKMEQQRLVPGELTRCRISILNAGTLPAQGLVVRVILPAQAEVVDSLDRPPHLRDSSGAVIYRLETLNIGKFVEYTVDMKVREDSIIGQELRSRIEVINGQLQTRDFFSSTAAMIRADQPLTVAPTRP